MRTLALALAAIALAAPAPAQDLDAAVELYNNMEYQQAADALRKAVEASPDDARANRYLGLALLELEKPDEAATYLSKSNGIEENGDTKGAIARMYAEKKDTAKAEAALEGASGPDAAYARGFVQFTKKDYAASVESFETFLESHPKHAYAHYYAGMACNGAKRPDKMLTHLEHFLRLKPTAREASGVRAILKTGR